MINKIKKYGLLGVGGIIGMVIAKKLVSMIKGA